MIKQKQLHELFNYREDGQLIWKVRKAKRTKIGEPAGTKHHTGYCVIEIDSKQYAAHRLVYLYHYGELPRMIDHINRDRGDNRIENLRPVNNSDNRVNSTTTWTNHNVRGVKETRNGDFEARISKNGKYYHLGTHKTLEEASAAYQNARKELYSGVFS